MTSTGANAAAIAAALNGSAQQIPQYNRQSWTLKSTGTVRASDPNLKSGNSLNRNETYVDDDDVMQDDDAVADGMPDGRAGNSASKARTRRASEGAYLSKGEGKRASGELRCEKCGKGYKHSSCLTKHRSVPCVSLLPIGLHQLAAAIAKRAIYSRLGVCEDGVEAFLIPTNLGL